VRNEEKRFIQFLLLASFSSKSTISFIWTKNHLSIFVELKISSMVKRPHGALKV